MDVTTFLGFLLVVLVGGAMFTLIMALVDSRLGAVQEERQRFVLVEPAVDSASAMPAVLALDASAPPPAISSSPDGLVAFLENHVKAEQAMAARFVQFPSVDSLYRQARPSARPTMH